MVSSNEILVYFLFEINNHLYKMDLVFRNLRIQYHKNITWWRIVQLCKRPIFMPFIYNSITDETQLHLFYKCLKTKHQ